MLASANDLPHDIIMGFQIACLHVGLATLWPAEWSVPSVDFFRVFRLLACENVLPHYGQLNDLSTVWIFS